MKPILFNVEMVRAILDGRKTVTRRLVKPQPLDKPIALPYQPGDILYVRETFCGWYLPGFGVQYVYKASNPSENKAPTGSDPDDDLDIRPWRPSIHMPKEAARIFLRVTDVRAERLQEITGAECVREGIPQESLMEVGEAFTVGQFADLWDSTTNCYDWDANPWVWVIDFERISRDEALEEEKTK